MLSIIFIGKQVEASQEYSIESEASQDKINNFEKLAGINIFKIGKNKKSVPDNNPSYAEIKEAVDFASNVTGVRKDFLMGMLAMESDFGKNTGGCTYEEVEEGAEKSYKKGLLSQRAWGTFNHRREVIKGITDDLGYDYRKIKVSCNPSRYSGTGGALGVPQFMPDTWMEYKDRIADVVGKKNPDPWDTNDGVVAMALKLSDVYGVTAHNRSAERNAAKLYLSGTTSWKYDWYANRVVYWKESNSIS
jgi:membrane-bound lytic murein transglycosylase B